MTDRRTSPAMLMVAHEYAHLMIGIGVRVRPDAIRTLEELEELKRSSKCKTKQQA